MMVDFLWPHLQALPYFRATLRAVEARLMQEVTLPPPVLDIGCGDGHFASVAFHRRVDVGLDPHRPSLRQAAGWGGYRLLVCAAGARIPAAPAAFGSAMSNSVLEHIPGLDAVLVAVNRALQSGAPFVFTVPNPGYRTQLSVPRALNRVGLSPLARGYTDWFMWMSRTKNLFDEHGWREHLAQAGFEIERTFRYFSPRALHALEWGHYFGAPCVLARWITGQWILAPHRWNLWLTDRLVRRYYDELPNEQGTYSFYLARKVRDAAG
jgi:SAM-dependent methyltransferase